jgi:hypothetical protein
MKNTNMYASRSTNGGVTTSINICIVLELFSPPLIHGNFMFGMLADVRLKYMSKSSTSTSNIAPFYWKTNPDLKLVNGEIFGHNQLRS